MLPLLKPRTSPGLPPLHFHNTLSGALEKFVPLAEGKVKMYNCGPTVYGPQHVGNMRAAVFANTLRRALEYWGYEVKQVINLTDFGHLSSDADEGEDKMTAGLRREGLELTMENMRALAEKYAERYFEDIRKLGLDTGAVTFPRASDYVAEQIVLVKTLEEKGYAYQTGRGVYFDTSRFPSYGMLGHIDVSGQREGARLTQENPEKRNPQDFVLWKADPKLGWDSPWGTGFPGWHTECVAMNFALLGKQIDIHTGGIEHIPIHHNNEIAQATAATGKRFVANWLHNDHLTIGGHKIAKSVGNTAYVDDVIACGFDPLALRYWLLTGHYRSQMNFSWEALEGADTARRRLLAFFAQLPEEAEALPDSEFMRAVTVAIADDLDTPAAIARIWDLTRDERVSPEVKRASLAAVEPLLGIGLGDTREAQKLSVVPPEDVPEDVSALLQERQAARDAKDFAKADELRQKIQERGFEIQDTPGGTNLYKS